MNNLNKKVGTLLNHERVTIVGAGKVGRALARALCDAGYNMSAILDQNQDRARQAAEFCNNVMDSGQINDLNSGTTLLLICVPDDAIQSVAEELTALNRIRLNCVVAHTSGALSSGVLNSLSRHTELLASMHPIQTLAGTIDDWHRFSGAFFGIEGNDIALYRLEKVVSDLKGNVIKVPEDRKNMVHLACVLASNFMVTLLGSAIDILTRAGFAEDDARAMLKPIILTTVENITTMGAVDALSGPIARGDAGTLKNHLATIRHNCPELLDLYVSCARRTITIAEKKGKLSKEDIQVMMTLMRDRTGDGLP